MNTKYYKYIKYFDIIILVLLVPILIGFLSFDYKILGLDHPLFNISHEYEIYFEILIWILFGVMFIDLYIKYNAIKDFEKFLKHNLLDIVIFLLMPFLLPIKIFKISLKTYKIIKFSKHYIMNH